MWLKTLTIINYLFIVLRAWNIIMDTIYRYKKSRPITTRLSFFIIYIYIYIHIYFFFIVIGKRSYSLLSFVLVVVIVSIKYVQSIAGVRNSEFNVKPVVWFILFQWYFSYIFDPYDLFRNSYDHGALSIHIYVLEGKNQQSQAMKVK